MAFLQLQELDWHEGETQMQELMHVGHRENTTVPALSPQLANHLRIAPLVALGILDDQHRPWTTIWGGEESLGAVVAQGIIGIRSAVTPKYDPVIDSLFEGQTRKQVIRPQGKGRMVGGLTIDLETRKRVKLFGRVVVAAIDTAVDEVTDVSEATVEAQLVLRIEQSLGNCPKYLNKKHIVKDIAAPRLISDSPHLSPEAIALIGKADLFFISSYHGDKDMDTNHRGGPAGFTRIVSNDETGATLVWPEYSGNRMYQTLGNLKVNPRAGICVPDFETGDMLYVTGTTEILIGQAASDVLPRTTLAVKFNVTAARMVAQALPFRGIPGELSPYNPRLRYVVGEKKQIEMTESPAMATLVKQTRITPTISRYQFTLDRPADYRAGQYVTFDLSSLLDIGYSHMRNDDPTSLNDDFVRTFTVSSSPYTGANSLLNENEFEITIRHVGAVTHYMSRFEGSAASNRAQLEVPIKGFGGDFEVKQIHARDQIVFIAAGIGITPLLAALDKLDAQRIRLLWTLRAADMPLVSDAVKRHPQLASCAEISVTGEGDGETAEVQESTSNVKFSFRRLSQSDLAMLAEERVYICAPTAFRTVVAEWLPEKELIFEDFNF